VTNLPEKIRDIHCPVIFYELLPPTSTENTNVETYVECAIKLLEGAPIKIDAINIPDIQDEYHKHQDLFH